MEIEVILPAYKEVKQLNLSPNNSSIYILYEERSENQEDITVLRTKKKWKSMTRQIRMSI